MASLIPGFEYDIFISYRQKDNKYDGWVTEFVDNLKRELEATFKEEISVYFDINPHNGLLDTHDVDASLKDKLKCLVFVPVISRTYCDPKSFAWEYEFKAFIDLASQDKFGLKVKVPGGNVASRVLPVRIYDLDISDIKLCESVLGGAIRGIDFVYKESGVNRPLATDDDEEKNLEGTNYRNQINKTANAIKEIISGLKPGTESITVGKGRQPESWEEERIPYERKEPVASKMFRPESTKMLIGLLLLILVLAGAFVIYKVASLVHTSKTIAVIPFTNPKDDNTLRTLCIGSMDAIISKLQELKKLTVRSRFSSLQYINTEVPLSELREKLNINYLIDINLVGTKDNLKMWVGLTSTKRNKQIWSDQFEVNEKQLMSLFTEITETLASELNVVSTPEEIKNIKQDLTQNPDAFANYIIGNARLLAAMSNLFVDSASFMSAIRMYDIAIGYDPDFAIAYARRSVARSWGYYTGQLNSTQIDKCWSDIKTAEKINKDLPDVQIAYGFYYYYCKKDYLNALINFYTASLMDPEDYQPLFYMALVYRKMGDWEKSQNMIHRVIKLKPQESLYLTNIGLSYTYLHSYDSALIFHQKAIDANPGWAASYANKIQTLILQNGNTDKARIVLDSATKNVEGGIKEYNIILDIYDGRYADAMEEAVKSDSADFTASGNKYLYLASINGFLNKPETADRYFDTALVTLDLLLRKDTTNKIVLGYHAIANAGKGNVDLAIKEGKRALELAVENKDKMEESDMKMILMQIYTMVGKYDYAMEDAEFLLNNPSCLSLKLMQLDPGCRPLLNLPAYKTLLKKYSDDQIYSRQD
jgi:TolB-like protein/Tfp pilus assembly protein PilF